jgi:predicted pyridoxine 5'-phosphate oxidase superfamily flavin-nucleotide-binding protein
VDDPFAGALSHTDDLQALYAAAEPRAWRKDIGRLDEMCRRLIAASPMVFLASADTEGRLDVTPRGGPAGFVSVLGERTLGLPDATGNRRLDALRNIIATGRAGLLFVTPGRAWTLRVNGRACVTTLGDVERQHREGLRYRLE